jgi:regulator of protease activity HflC (stomatin/prohibitin superfamily)
MLDRFLNYLTLIAWIILVLYVVLYFLRNLQTYGYKEALKKLLSYRLLAIVIILIAITLLNVSLVFVEPQQSGVVVSLVEPDGYRQQPFRSGLHWIVPLMERVVIYPMYWQTYTMSGEPSEGSKAGNDSISARSSDGQEVYLDASVIFRIDPNEVTRVHIDWQQRYLEDFIRPLLRGLVRTEVSQFTADEVNSSKRKVLESNLDELIREEFRSKGFILDRFLLRRIAFSPQYASAVEAKQVAEQARIQKEYEAQQIRTIAEANRDRIKLEAEGEAQAILITAQSEQEALKLIAEALQRDPNLLVYRYIDKLSPGIQVMLIPNNNPLLLPLPNLSGTPAASPVITPTLNLTPQATVTPFSTSTPSAP